MQDILSFIRTYNYVLTECPLYKYKKFLSKFYIRVLFYCVLEYFNCSKVARMYQIHTHRNYIKK